MTQPSLSDLISSYESSDAIEGADAAPQASQPSAGGDKVAAFVERYKPVAERAAEQIGVSPEVLLGQWGLETGWGKSVIPGTNNLGNIKAPKGQGVQATDNMTGSRDGYRAYGTDLDFGDDYARLIGRNQRYKNAVGAGEDAQGYFSALKQGGYAEDPDYVSKGVKAVGMVRNAMGQTSEPRRMAPADMKTVSPAPAQGQPSLADLVSQYDTGPSLPEMGYREAPKDKSLLDNASDLASATWGGIKDLGRSIAATGYTATGQLTDVELLSKAQQLDEAEKPEEYRALMQEIQTRKAANPDAPWWQALGDVGDAAWKNKLGTAQMVASQLPNSAAVLGGAWAGGKAGAIAGSVFGPAGTVVGGVAGAIGGMFLGNYLVETGSKATQAAADGFTQDEADRVLTEGAKKAAVITGVDMATLGIGNVASKTIFGSAAKAGARAEMKVLADAGIDVVNPQAVIRALSTQPALATAAKSAGEAAAKAATTTGMRVAQAGGGMALESVGEGVGEYYGEMAATGKGDVYDAALEALSSMPQSAVETAFNYSTTKSNELSPTGIVRAAAERPNSPISSALKNSGVLDAVDQQQAEPPAEPSQPEVDPMVAFATGVEDMARQTRMLDQLDALGVEGSGRRDFLEALATVRNAKLDQRTPLLREQAKEAIERMVSMVGMPATYQAGKAFQAMMPQQGSLAQQRASEEQAAANGLDAANVAGQQWQGLGVQPEGETQTIPGSPREPGTAAGNAGAAWQQMQDGMQPQGDVSFAVPMNGPVGETSSLEDAPKAHEIVPAPKVEIPGNGPGTAQVRKRKAELGALVASGFDTITQDATGVTVLANQKTGQAHVLSLAMDQKLAKDAVAGLVRAVADQSPNSPNNDLKESTPAQNKAGNYLKPQVSLNGYSIKVENPAGSTRSGTDPNGKQWSVTMGSDYGYISGTKAADGDGVDVYVGDAPEAAGIFVIDQVNPDGTFDEPKVVMGVRDEEHARQTYLSNYEDGWTGLGAITPMTRDQFDSWVKGGGPLAPVSLNIKERAPQRPADERVTKLAEAQRKEGAQVEITEPAQDDPRLMAFTPLADAFEREFGARPIPVVVIGRDAFDGVMHNGNYYVNLDSAQMPIAETIAHEFGHTQEDRPAVRALEDAMMALVPEAVRKKYYGYIARTNDVAKVLNPDGSINLDASYAAATAEDLALLKSEIIKDFMGKRFNDRAWLRRLAQQKPREFGEFVQQWIALLDRLIEDFKGALNRAPEKDVDALMRSHVAELEGMKAIAVEVAAEWAKANPGLAKEMGVGQDGSVRFAKRAGPIESRDTRQFLVPEVEGAFNADTGNIAIYPAISFGKDGPSYESMPVRVRVGQHGETEFGGTQFGATHRLANAKNDPTRRGLKTPDIGDSKQAVVERTLRDLAVTALTANQAYQGVNFKKEILVRSPATGETLSLHMDYDSDGKKFWAVKTSIPKTVSSLEGGSGRPVPIQGITLDKTDGSTSDAAVRETLKKLQASVPFLSDKASFSLAYSGQIVNAETAEVLEAPPMERKRTKVELPRDANGKIILNRNKQKLSAREIQPGVYGQPREGSVSAVGYHYSKQPRDILSSSFYGTGLKGAERERLAGVDAADIRPRIHFYVDTGNGVRPESGVGGIPHKVELRNLYDANQDPLGLVRDAQPKDGEPRVNAWERAIMKAGFDGYLARNEGEPLGQVVLVGRHVVMPIAGRPREFAQPAPRTTPAAPTKPVTRRIGDRMVRRLVSGDFTDINKVRQMLADMAPTFKVEFGEASTSEREAETVNAIMEEQGAGFRFSRRDLLPKDISQRLIVDLKSGGYKALDNDIVVIVPTADGADARLTVNAREAMQQLDRREDALEHVKECLL